MPAGWSQARAVAEAALSEQRGSEVRERQALTRILDNKMRSLVAELYAAIPTVPGQVCYSCHSRAGMPFLPL